MTRPRKRNSSKEGTPCAIRAPELSVRFRNLAVLVVVPLHIRGEPPPPSVCFGGGGRNNFSLLRSISPRHYNRSASPTYPKFILYHCSIHPSAHNAAISATHGLPCFVGLRNKSKCNYCNYCCHQERLHGTFRRRLGAWLLPSRCGCLHARSAPKSLHLNLLWGRRVGPCAAAGTRAK